MMKWLDSTKLGASLFALAIGGVGVDAQAQGYPPRGSVGYDFARVVEVQPIYENVNVAEPRQECWDEPVTYPNFATSFKKASAINNLQPTFFQCGTTRRYPA